MSGFGDLNLKLPIILAISVFVSSLNSMLNSIPCSAELGMKKVLKPQGLF